MLIGLLGDADLAGVVHTRRLIPAVAPLLGLAHLGLTLVVPTLFIGEALSAEEVRELLRAELLVVVAVELADDRRALAERLRTR